MSEQAPFLTPVYCPYCRGGGILTAWHVEVGQPVAAQLPLTTVIDGRGATVLILAPYTGRVASILKDPGEAVHLNMPLLLLADTRCAQRPENRGKSFPTHLTRWMRDDRQRRGWRIPGSVGHIAKGLGIQGNTVWRWWGGMEHPTEEQLVALAALLGVSEEELEAAREALATFPPKPRPSKEPRP